MNEEDLYLSNDDYDVEIENDKEEDQDGKKKKKGGQQTREDKDDMEETEQEDEIIIELPEDDKHFQINDMIDEIKKSPEIETNKLYTGVVDPVKIELLHKLNNIDEYIVPLNKRRSSHILGKAEKTELIGIRAQHISMGAEPFVEIDNETDPVEIAEKEMKQGLFPLLLKRRLNNYTFEVWDPNNMTINWQE